MQSTDLSVRPRPRCRPALVSLVAAGIAAILGPLTLSAYALGCTASIASAQGKDKKKERKLPDDPYLDHDTKSLKAVGYVRLGPFQFGKHATDQIDHVLGLEDKLIWIETAHFKIGCALPTYKLRTNDKEEKKKLRKELAELKKKLPKMRKVPKKLDPWLLAHLWAMRCEKLYAMTEKLLGASATVPGPGPHLGMSKKYLLLILGKRSSFEMFCSTFLKEKVDSSWRWYDYQNGTLFYGTSPEYGDGDRGANDSALHCEIACNLGRNLLQGYGGFPHALPDWWGAGFGHWVQRKVDKRYPQVESDTTYGMDPKRMWNWEPRVRGRVEHEHFPSAKKLMSTSDRFDFDLIEEMMMWSRVDYLIREKADRIPVFAARLTRTIAPEGTALVPTNAQIIAQQEIALKEAFDLDYESFDGAWSLWVRKKYAKR